MSAINLIMAIDDILKGATDDKHAEYAGNLQERIEHMRTHKLFE